MAGTPSPLPHRSIMDILYTLIPLSVVLVLAILGFLAWAVYGGQFEDLDAEAERILLDDDRAAPPRPQEASQPPAETPVSTAEAPVAPPPQRS